MIKEIHIYRYFICLLAFFIICSGTAIAIDFTYMPIDYGSPSGFTICHPSTDTITGSTISADFSVPVTEGDAPFTVRFYDTSYGTHDFWEWDFGDGELSYEQYPVHTYYEPGIFDVTLTIGTSVYYQTSAERYNNTSYGQYTNIKWSSDVRKIEYIIVNPEGTGSTTSVPDDWIPETKKPVKMPGGFDGIDGNLKLSGGADDLSPTGSPYATTLTITPNTEKAYTESLELSGVYRIYQTIPYNTKF